MLQVANTFPIESQDGIDAFVPEFHRTPAQLCG